MFRPSLLKHYVLMITPLNTHPKINLAPSLVQWNLVTKRSDTTKPSHNKAILPVRAYYVFYPYTTRQPPWPQGPRHKEAPLYINLTFRLLAFRSKQKLNNCGGCPDPSDPGLDEER